MSQKQQGRESSNEQERHKTAVPYISPPPPDESELKRFRSPMVNGVLLSFGILLVGFMLYNFIGHQLTQLSADSTVNTTTQITSPTPLVSSSPTPSLSPSPSK